MNDVGNDDYKKSVGFLGVEGSYSHKAFTQYFDSSFKGCGYKSFRDIFENLKLNNICYAVLPIENSSTGGITEVYDLFLKYDFYIIGEECVKVDHNLLGVMGAKIEDIQTVYSHSQGISQCEEFFLSYPDWKLIPFESTAGSAKFVQSSNDSSIACVAAREAASLYGLNILKENICSSYNYTRFVIISRNESQNSVNDKISIQLSLSHTAGSLFKVLRHFEENNINMLKIESRPVKGKPWEYNFFIDFTGNVSEDATKTMLNEIKRESVALKFLGNYKSHCIKDSNNREDL